MVVEVVVVAVSVQGVSAERDGDDFVYFGAVGVWCWEGFVDFVSAYGAVCFFAEYAGA